MLKGGYRSFVLPKAEYSDIGTAREDIYLPAFNKALDDFFPEYEFTKHYSSSLTGQFNVAKDT
jgi:hypothetical protein